MPPPSTSGPATPLAWIDVAKGFCLVAVVTLYTTTHLTEGLGRQSWMQAWVAFAQPFRMPDFFFLSGILLGRVIDRPWLDYLDRKVAHYLWFFFLWSALYYALRVATDGPYDMPRGLGAEFVKTMTWGPFAMLWFIQMLPLYFVLTKLLRRIPWPVVLLAAAIWHWLPIETQWTQVDRAGERYVFFFAGYALAPWVIRFAAWAAQRPREARMLIAVWVVLNASFVWLDWAPVHPMPLVLGLAGALGVIAVSAQLQRHAPGRLLAQLGARSLPIFLGFFLPMVALERLWYIATSGTSWRAFDAGVLSLMLAAASIGLALLGWKLLRGSWAYWLYERPAWARLKPRKSAVPESGLPHGPTQA